MLKYLVCFSSKASKSHSLEVRRIIVQVFEVSRNNDFLDVISTFFRNHTIAQNKINDIALKGKLMNYRP